MSFLRISNPVATAFVLADLGITVAASASNIVLSNQFSVNDLYLSADLEAAIIAGDLTVQIDYGTGFASIAAIDYTNRDALSSWLNVYEITNENNNEDLVDGSEASTLHNHGSIYYTKSETNAITFGALVGLDGTGFTTLSPLIDDLQEFADAVDAQFKLMDLDTAYTNDIDGILNVNGTSKPLNLKSNNVNDIIISRTNGTDNQNAVQFDVSGDEILLGSPLVGGLNQIDARILTNLIVDGNLTITGTLTDTTVNDLNVTNANIRLRDGSEGIAGADAYIEIERGTSGADARLLWNETTDRWMAGLVGDMATIALLEKNEIVKGIYEMQGPGATSPSLYLTDKAAAPSINLGSATQIPMAMINNTLAIYDKTNARNRFLSVARMFLGFTGRDNANNANEYARFGAFTSNQSSARLMKNMVLVGMSIQTSGAETWTARVRKNGVATNLASLAASAVEGAQTSALDIDFTAGDKIEVYIDGTSVNRPIILLEFAERF